MKIAETSNNRNLIEDTQYHEIRYSFLKQTDDGYEALHLPALCREFWNDIAHYMWGDPVGLPRYRIYGFDISEEALPVMPTTQHVLWYLAPDEKETFRSNLSIIEALNDNFPECGTIGEPIFVDEGVILVLPEGWFSSSYHTSFLSLLTKCMSIETLVKDDLSSRSLLIHALNQIHYFDEEANEYELMCSYPGHYSGEEVIDVMERLPVDMDATPNGYDVDPDDDYIDDSMLHETGLFSLLSAIHRNGLDDSNIYHNAVMELAHDQEEFEY